MSFPDSCLSLARRAGLVSLFAAGVSSSFGASQTWIGGAGSWSTGTNWTPNTWTAGNTAVFNASAGTVTVGTQTAGGLTFNVGGYTLDSGTLTLNTGSILTTSGGVTTFAAGLTLTSGGAAVALTKAGSGTLSITTVSSLGAGATPATWTVNGGTLSGGYFDSVLSVPFGSVLGAAPSSATTQVTLNSGTIEFRLSFGGTPLGANRTFSVSAAGGAIRDSSGASNSYANAISNGATSGSLYLNTTTGTIATFTGVISGGGGVTVNGAGTVALNGTNTFTGGVTLSGGTLSINAGPSIGATPGSPSTQLTFSGNSTLQFSAGIGTGSAINTNRGFLINNGVTATFDTQGFTIYTNNAISAQSGQTGVLNKTGLGTLYLGNNNANDRDNAFLTVTAGAGTIVLNKGSASIHAVGGGGLTLNGGSVTLAGTGNDQIYDAAPVTVTSGTFDMAGKSETVGSLSGASAGTITNSGTSASTLTVGGTLGTGGGTYAGAIADNAGGGGTLAFSKAGSGTLTLSGASTYTGATTVNGGTLSLDNAGTTTPRLANTSGITVGGGTLQLSSTGGSSTNRINDSATITLAGGTFNTGGLSEGSSSGGVPTAGMGALTLTANSVIDLGSGASILAFADSGASIWTNGVTLSIWNWTGSAQGNGTDQIFIGNSASGLNNSYLGQILIYLDSGATLAGATTILSTGEITAVPEPATVYAAIALVGLAGFRSRKRLVALLARLCPKS